MSVVFSSAGWGRMLALFAAAGFLEVVAWGQLSAFTPLYLPTFGISAADVAGWVAGITVSSN